MPERTRDFHGEYFQESIIPSLTPLEVSRLLNTERDVHLLDVREEWEYRTVHLQGALLIPLSELSNHLDELSVDTDWIVYCHHGVRSKLACSMLRRAGLPRVYNMTGGIDHWAQTVDPAITRY